MTSTIRCAVCSPCLTLLASPDSAGGGLGRACVVFLRGVLFSLVVKITVPISRVYMYRYISLKVNMCVRSSCRVHFRSTFRILCVELFFFHVPFSIFFVWHCVVSQPSSSYVGSDILYYSRTWYLVCIYMRTECCCCSLCCYTAVAAAPVLLLPAAVHHRMPDDKICC